MIFTADQIVAHLVGDYLLQSHWMATRKRENSVAAAIHALCYTLPFLLITQSPLALAIIAGTHFIIDRFGLARFVVWLKNGPIYYQRAVDPSPASARSLNLRPVKGGLRWEPLTATGYQDDVPIWLSVWLLIITDNTLHLICNGFAIWLAR